MKAGDYKFGGTQEVEVMFYLRHTLGLSLQGVRKRTLTAIRVLDPRLGLERGTLQC